MLVERIQVVVVRPVARLRGELRLPGDREAIRRRATAAALHLVRDVLAQSRHNSA